MYILQNCCGWIPNAPVHFVSKLIDLIKNLTPVVLIIMGSLDFGKAVISQKDDEIKKAQGAFVKKLIAGAAVFFVIVFAKWVVQILQNSGISDSNGAMNCVSLLLNGQYQQCDTIYYEGPNITTTTTNSNKTQASDLRSCYENRCANLNGTAKTECQKSCDRQFPTTTTLVESQTCLIKHDAEIKACIEQNKGNTASNLHSYQSYYNACIEDFKSSKTDTGTFAVACEEYENCMHNNNYMDKKLTCYEMTYNPEEHINCTTQYLNYQAHVYKYGSYTDDFDEINEKCNDYANNAINSNNYENKSDLIENYCQKLFCN